MGAEPRTQEKRIYDLLASKPGLCTHQGRALRRNRRRWLSLSWRGGVKEDDRRHVLPEGRCYAGQLLGQHPNADAHMAGRKGEIHQLACTPFHVFGGRAVVEDYERVGAREKPSHYLQPLFHGVLLADYHIHSWIVFAKPVVGLVVRERRADEHDVVELSAERAVDMVHHEP